MAPPLDAESGRSAKTYFFFFAVVFFAVFFAFFAFLAMCPPSMHEAKRCTPGIGMHRNQRNIERTILTSRHATHARCAFESHLFAV
ncbi:hypothetical protein XH89_15630 [Bradyrhizobium sp. CCBAU 53340]|nr:hypothetical protein XH89_15630 [Bradyrhizobium sp. CCBAU 53340]